MNPWEEEKELRVAYMVAPLMTALCPECLETKWKIDQTDPCGEATCYECRLKQIRDRQQKWRNSTGEHL